MRTIGRLVHGTSTFSALFGAGTLGAVQVAATASPAAPDDAETPDAADH